MAKAKQTAITVAVIALVGTLGAALINNRPWDDDEGNEPQSNPEPVRLLVVVRDATDQSLVRGAVVEITAGASIARDPTGTDGRASFTLSEDLIGEIADVSASAPGYSQVSEKYRIPDHAPRHTLVLTRIQPAQSAEIDRDAEERTPPKERIEVVACANIRVTAEWEGLRPSTKNDRCRYAPPAGWQLIRHRVEVHSENNGSYEIEYGENGMEVRVKATAHGSPVDRKRGWINITVYALIEEME